MKKEKNYSAIELMTRYKSEGRLLTIKLDDDSKIYGVVSTIYMDSVVLKNDKDPKIEAYVPYKNIRAIFSSFIS